MDIPREQGANEFDAIILEDRRPPPVQGKCKETNTCMPCERLDYLTLFSIVDDTLSTVAFLLSLLAVIIGITALLLLFYRLPRTKTEAMRACSLSECAEARIYVETICNPQADPCQDFYNHVCGKWIQKTHGREGFLRDVLSRFLIILHDTTQDLTKAHSAVTRAAVSLYNSCRTFLSAHTALQDTIRPALNVLDVARVLLSSTLEELIEVILQLFLTSGLTSVIEVWHRMATDNTFLHVVWGGNLRSRLGLHENNEAFEQYLAEVVVATGFNVTFEEVLNLDRNIGSVPHGLIKIVIMPLSAIDDIGPPFNLQFWKRAIGAAIPSFKNAFATGPIVVTGLAEIKHTVQVLRSVPLQMVKPYLSIYSLTGILEFHFSANHQNLLFVEQTQLCLKATKTALMSHWSKIIDVVAPDATAWDTVTKLFNAVKELLSSQMPVWMDNSTQMKSKIKLENIRLRFHIQEVNDTSAFPPALHGDFVSSYLSLLGWSRRWQLKFPVSPVLEEQEDAELRGLPLYSDKFESLFMPTYLLQRPIFYSEPVEFYFNYGSLGSLIAKELAEAIGPNEHNAKILGGHKNWWTPLTRQQFQNASTCFQPSVRKAHGADGHNPKFTDELRNSLFVWTLAARVAFDIAKKMLPETRYDIMDAQRIFFIRFCLLSCDSADVSAARERCMVPLMHMMEFADTFQCSVNSTMNLGERCWKF